MDVSKNRGTPKWMVYNGKPYEQMDDLGVPLFLETPIYRITSYKNLPRSAGGSFNHHRSQIQTVSQMYTAPEKGMDGYNWGEITLLYSSYNLVTTYNPIYNWFSGAHNRYFVPSLPQNQQIIQGTWSSSHRRPPTTKPKETNRSHLLRPVGFVKSPMF